LERGREPEGEERKSPFVFLPAKNEVWYTEREKQ